MPETTYEINFVAKADLATLDQVERRLKDINGQIDQMTKSGNFGPDLSSLIKEETDLKLRLTQMQLFAASDSGATSQASRAPMPRGANSIGADFMKESAPAVSAAEDVGINMRDLSFTLSKIAGAVSVGVAIGNKIQDQWFNWASSLAAGGLSTEQDQRQAQAMISDQGKMISGFYERAKGVGSIDDKYALMNEAANVQTSLIEQKSGLAINETAQRKALEDSIAQLQAFWEKAFEIDPAMIAEMSAAKEKAQADAAAEASRQATKTNMSDALTLEENHRRLQELTPEERRDALFHMRKSMRSLVDSPVGYISEESREAASSEVVRLTQSINQVDREIDRDAERDQKKSEAIEATRQIVELQTKLTEAIAAGNDEEEARVRWLLKVQQITEQTGDESLARRAANADSGARGRRGETPARSIDHSVDVSSFAASGHSIGESRAAAGAAMESRNQERASNIAEETNRLANESLETLKRVAKAVENPKPSKVLLAP